MKIHLVDPYLLDVGGHHLETDVRLAEELTAAGHETSVFAHENISDQARAVVSTRARLVPLFRNAPYGDPQSVDPVAGDVIVFIDGAALFADAIRRIPPADIWIWPTLLAAHVYACVLAKVHTPMAGCFQFEPTFLSPHGRAWTRFAFLRAHRAGQCWHVGANGPLLQREYAPLTADGRVSLLPWIDDGAPCGVCKERAQIIGFFGHQRGEKGAHLLPSLITQLLQDGYHVVLHDSGHMIRAQEMPGLKVLGYVRSLAEEMARCDLVVVPYSPSAYRVKESGVVMEALASGVPVVVPEATASALRVREWGVGTTFVNLCVEEVHAAIAQAKQEFPRIARAAYNVSRTWRETHGVKRYVAATLAGLESAMSARGLIAKKSS